MLDHKIRVLWVNEFSEASSGFSTYGRYILPYLHNHPDFEVAELACTPDPYAEVLMGDGETCFISAIKPGDTVFTRLGKQKVIQVHKNMYNGEIINISREGIRGQRLCLTPNHPVLCIRKENAYSGPRKARKLSTLPEINWVNAGDLRTGDFVAYRKIGLDELPDKHEIVVNGFTIPLNSEIGFLFGWFLAEGHIYNHQLLGETGFGVCGSGKEKSILEKFDLLMQKYFGCAGTTLTKRPDKELWEIEFFDRKVAKIFNILLGSRSRDKSINSLLFVNNKEFLLSMFASYFEGDGTVTENSIRCRTVSHALGKHLYKISTLLGFHTNLTFDKQHNYELAIYGVDAYNVTNKWLVKDKGTFAELTRSERFETDRFIFTKIVGIEKSFHDGFVYNIGVENDHSYVMNDFVVHNCYTHALHPKIMDPPWKVYPNEPDPRLGPEARKSFDSDPLNQFGKAVFDEVCLDFKPHVVLTIRDPWHDNWIAKSAFRHNFKWISMPTCDGEPQKIEWLNEYLDCDVLLTYSEWAKNVFESWTHGKLKVFDVASPPVDISVYHPRDKAVLRAKHGLNENAFIISTVMRNQPRKLFPDLFRAFVKYLEKCESAGLHDLAANSYLHCHTTQPDMGWDLPVEIRRHNLSHKVIFTYMCDQCRQYYVHFYKGEQAQCLKCGNHTARFPHTAVGITREQLADIMSVADVYVQYATNGGWEMGIGDAKACGLPCVISDYSAMVEQAHAPGGIPVPVKTYFQEPVAHTSQLRALLDNDAAADIFLKLGTMSRSEREAIGQAGYEFIKSHYTPEIIAGKWIAAIKESKPEIDISKTWFGPPRMLPTSFKMPQNLTNEQFVYWCFATMLQRPDQVTSYLAQKIVSMLNLGYEPGQTPDGKPTRNKVTRESIINYFVSMVNYHNMWEAKRLGINTAQEFKVI
jgi:glycosyltransferase involved in cell wall biosynthesis